MCDGALGFCERLALSACLTLAACAAPTPPRPLVLQPDLVANYAAWEKARLDASGLFWQHDGEDGMEVSIGGSGLRPTINSYLFGDAVAIANIAELANQTRLAEDFRAKAARLKGLVQTNLWDDRANFFKTLPRGRNQRLADVRELLGYAPWYFNLPDRAYEIAWRQLVDPQGFFAAYGPTTAERRHPRFRFAHEHECLWNGPSWPYATTQTFVALANVLNYHAGRVAVEGHFARPVRSLPGKADYLKLLKIYAHSQHLTRADGREIAHGAGIQRVTGPLPAGAAAPEETGTHAGWRKYEHNPVLGGALGTCFDVALLRERGRYRMWFSWRPKKSLALVESPDGIHWSEPGIVLGPNSLTQWEDDINRPVVVKRADGYHLWYTGQANGHSRIGYATSRDGAHWTRRNPEPVVSPDQPWEKVAVMCPHVLWDVKQKLFRMWYSAGDQYEPDAIGYATSADGLHWTKLPANPIFHADPCLPWEQHKVTACQVIPRGGWHYMFYIGFRDVNHAQIGLARSRDGITGWERFHGNPIISPGENQWDHDACYKPFAIFDGRNWLLWYNGRRGGVEQIGLATHDGGNLGWRGD